MSWIDQVKAGDALLYTRGGGNQATLYGRAIRFICGSAYTHSALVVEDWCGLLYYVEQSDRCRVIPLASLADTSQDITVYRHPTMAPIMRTAPIEAASRYINRTYGYASLADDLTQHLLGRVINGYIPHAVFNKNPFRMTCSSLNARILYDSYLSTPPFVKNWQVAEPDDFTERSGFIRVGCSLGISK